MGIPARVRPVADDRRAWTRPGRSRGSDRTMVAATACQPNERGYPGASGPGNLLPCDPELGGVFVRRLKEPAMINSASVAAVSGEALTRRTFFGRVAGGVHGAALAT